MRKGIIIGLGALLLGGCASMTPTKTTEQAFMIIDVPGDSSIRDQLLDKVIEVTQENMDSLALNRGIPPAALPENPSRFELRDPFQNTMMGGMMSGFSAMSQASGGMAIKVPTCQDPLMTMKSEDSTEGFNESTSFFVCVTQYSKGYRVDIYSTFEQTKGGLSMDAMSASIARSLVGDTSQIIPRTMKRLEQGVATIAEGTTVVDSYIPKNWKGFFLDETTGNSGNY